MKTNERYESVAIGGVELKEYEKLSMLFAIKNTLVRLEANREAMDDGKSAYEITLRDLSQRIGGIKQA